MATEDGVKGGLWAQRSDLKVFHEYREWSDRCSMGTVEGVKCVLWVQRWNERCSMGTEKGVKGVL